MSGDPAICGILLVDKPAGLTSHDVVARIRRAAGIRRVGHGGTLDPLATGLLVVAVGPATRLTRFFLADEKRYEATIAFGQSTETDDAEGAVTKTAPVPDAIRDPEHAAAAVAGLVREHTQVPPAYSALKVGGRKAYELARKGTDPQLAPRTVTVHDARLLGVDAAAPSWKLDLRVSKGTYVRSIARDLGLSEGTVAHLAALRRTASGGATIERARDLDGVVALATDGRLPDAFVDPVPLLGLEILDVDDGGLHAVANGRALPPGDPAPAQGEAVAVTHDERLLAVYRRRENALRAELVLPGGCSR